MIKRRAFSREFKMGILNELENKTVAQAAKEHNIHPMAVYSWKREYGKNPAKAFAGHGTVCKLESELAQYQRMVGKLYAEVEFLKKVSNALKEKLTQERIKRGLST